MIDARSSCADSLAGRNPPVSVVVIGGGVVGTACAIELRRRGAEVVLVEPQEQLRGASWGNAGHVAVEQVEPLASAATLRGLPRRLFACGGPVSLPARDWATWAAWGRLLALAALPRRYSKGRLALASLLARAIPAWRRLLALAEAPDLLRVDGHFVAWESDRTAAAGAARWRAADTGTATVRDATAAELARLRALLAAPVAGAVRIEGSGQVADLSDLADALAACLGRLGGHRRRARAGAVAPDGTGVVVRLENGDVLRADAAVAAAGAASAPLMRAHGHRVPLIAERGYHVEAAVSDAAWPADLPPVVFEDRSTIVTRFRSGLRAAGFTEFARAERPPDPRKWARLRSHAAALGLPLHEPLREWMGARPTLPDYLPAIGRSGGAVPGLFYAFGHHHLGLTLAAVTAEAVGAMVAGEAPAIDLAPFALDRFGVARRPSAAAGTAR